MTSSWRHHIGLDGGYNGFPFLLCLCSSLCRTSSFHHSIHSQACLLCFPVYPRGHSGTRCPTADEEGAAEASETAAGMASRSFATLRTGVTAFGEGAAQPQPPPAADTTATFSTSRFDRHSLSVVLEDPSSHHETRAYATPRKQAAGFTQSNRGEDNIAMTDSATEGRGGDRAGPLTSVPMPAEATEIEGSQSGRMLMPGAESGVGGFAALTLQPPGVAYSSSPVSKAALERQSTSSRRSFLSQRSDSHRYSTVKRG